jgi:predicted Zn-dependent protease
MNITIRICSLVCTAALTLAMGSGCASISEEDELALGREAHGEFEKEFGGRLRDQPVQRYVSAVGMDMVPYAKRPEMDWQFHVLESEQINAFAVPGGYIYITRGLLYSLRNEAQLAGVLGHEVAHVAKRHSAQQIQKAQQAQGVAVAAEIGGQIAGVEGVGNVAGLVANLSLMKYGRDQEHEADMYGLRYMTNVGYDPKGMIQTMKILKEASGGKGPPEMLSTHPDPGNRVEYLTEEIEKNYRRASRNGKLGKDTFEQHVLSRGEKVSYIPPGMAAWCLTCAHE